jgi:hypothetical protein
LHLGLMIPRRRNTNFKQDSGQHFARLGVVVGKLTTY